jgi:hypothetical protein
VGQQRGPPAPRKNEARLEERNVEAAAVEGDEPRRTLQQRRQRRQQRRLFVEVAHEVLRDDEAIILAPAGADEKGVGAGTAGQARRLGVEKQQSRRVRRRPLQPGEATEELHG